MQMIWIWYKMETCFANKERDYPEQSKCDKIINMCIFLNHVISQGGVHLIALSKRQKKRPKKAQNMVAPPFWTIPEIYWGKLNELSL